jgi:hypothetical protein
MISKTCVAPPVGSGSAGTASRTTKRIAKLFSWNSSMRLATVFSPSLASQPSSWPLTVGAGSLAEVSARR